MCYQDRIRHKNFKNILQSKRSHSARAKYCGFSYMICWGKCPQKKTSKKIGGIGGSGRTE
jgi:hypothetical protein